ncbi:MAG: glycosyltransferase family 4 protein [Cyanobacteria bacterium P01_H01_bin.15]
MVRTAVKSQKKIHSAYRPDILIVSRVFHPEPGGIQDYVYSRCLETPERVVVLTANCPDAISFDQAQSFRVYRWLMPDAWNNKLAKWGTVGGILKQIWYLINEFLGGLWLFVRYRYRYLEWGHGYDFPALWLLSRLLPVHTIVYLHGNDLLCPLRHRSLKFAFYRTLAIADPVVCNSRFTCEYLNQHLVNSLSTSKINTMVINPGVIEQRFPGADTLQAQYQLRQKIRARWQLAENAIAILSVGRLVRRKGFDRVIASFPMLLSEGLNVYYLICGKGPLEDELRSQVLSLNLEERILFAGYVPDEDLSGYYAACEIFAMPTYYEPTARSIEGFGIVYREAGYFGKPVIATRIGGVADAVHHLESGLLLPPDSGMEELTASLSVLCHDSSLRAWLGEKGREIASVPNFECLPHL